MKTRKVALTPFDRTKVVAPRCVFFILDRSFFGNVLATPMKIDNLDHLVLTVEDLKTTSDFYVKVLGMELIQFGSGRTALRFGSQKINLHQRGHEFEPKALVPTPGSADLCFITPVPLAEVVNHFNACGVAVLEGPVLRTGASGPIMSVYLRDPDMNLIEVSNLVEREE